MGDELDPVDEALALLEAGRRAATAYARPDLAARVEMARRRFTSRLVTVVVVGEFKTGKSALVNALLGLDLCPVDDDIATAVPTALRHDGGLSAQAWCLVGDERCSEPVEIAAIAAWVTESGAAEDKTGSCVLVEVGVASPLLADGLVIVDTPGAGGLGSLYGVSTLAALSLADAVIFVTGAGRELGEAELELLRAAHAACADVVVVVTKTDLHGEWRRIVELDQGHLRRATPSIGAPVLGLSSRLRRLAMERGDDDLDDESGFTDLLDWLDDCVARRTRQGDASVAAAELVLVAASLREQFTSARLALTTPEHVGTLFDALQSAQEHARTMTSAGARWQGALNEGCNDATSDMDHDFKARLRALSTAADEAVNAMDPATGWATFELWLSHAMATAVAEHSAFRHARLVACAAGVARVFGEEEQGAGLIDGPRVALQPVGTAAPLGPAKSAGVLSSGFTLVRSSYSGLAMFGFFGAMTGLVLTIPVMLGLGVVLGGKGLRDERAKQLAHRRAQGQASVHRYLDEAAFVLAKDGRDTLLPLQRELREHFTTRAAAMQQSAAASLRAAQQAHAAVGPERAANLCDIDAELLRIDSLASRAGALSRRVGSA